MCRKAGRRCARTHRAALAAAARRPAGRQPSAAKYSSPARAAEGRRDPARGGLGADADAVVLADEQDRRRHTLVGGVDGGVDRSERGGVVRGRIAETADDDAVVGPRQCESELGGPVDGEGDPDRSRKVGGDRRGLRDDVEIVPAEDLVPAATDRLLGRRDDPEQHVAQPVAAPTCCAPGEEEAARAVVQQRGIGGPQGGGDGDVSLVSRRADGVEPLPAGTEPARRQIEVSAPELGVEEVHGLPHRQRRSRLDRVVEASTAGLGAVGQGGHSGGEVLIDLFGHAQLLGDGGNGLPEPLLCAGGTDARPRSCKWVADMSPSWLGQVPHGYVRPCCCRAGRGAGSDDVQFGAFERLREAVDGEDGRVDRRGPIQVVEVADRLADGGSLEGAVPGEPAA